MIHVLTALILTISVWLGFPAIAFAHSVQTDYQVPSGSQMDLQVTFSTGEAFQKAPIKAYAPNNSSQPWLEGQTDDQGRFVFQPDAALQGNWRLEVGAVNTGDHGDILTVPVGNQGIDSQRISSTFPHQPEQISGTRFAIVYGVLGVLVVALRKQLGLFGFLKQR
jgi:nickel transport protein